MPCVIMKTSEGYIIAMSASRNPNCSAIFHSRVCSKWLTLSHNLTTSLTPPSCVLIPNYRETVECV